MDPIQTTQSAAQGTGSTGQQDGAMPVPPQILGGTEIYDQIMGKIEVDLLTVNLPTLDEKYKNESPEERSVRMARYAKSFVEYENQYAEYVKNVENKFRQIKRTAMQSLEQEAGQGDQGKMTELESIFNNSSQQ